MRALLHLEQRVDHVRVELPAALPPRLGEGICDRGGPMSLHSLILGQQARSITLMGLCESWVSLRWQLRYLYRRRGAKS